MKAINLKRSGEVKSSVANGFLSDIGVSETFRPVGRVGKSSLSKACHGKLSVKRLLIEREGANFINVIVFELLPYWKLFLGE